MEIYDQRRTYEKESDRIAEKVRERLGITPSEHGELKPVPMFEMVAERVADLLDRS